MKENNKPSWREIISFALGDGGCNLVWTTIGSYLTLYYTAGVKQDHGSYGQQSRWDSDLC